MSTGATTRGLARLASGAGEGSVASTGGVSDCTGVPGAAGGLAFLSVWKLSRLQVLHCLGESVEEMSRHGSAALPVSEASDTCGTFRVRLGKELRRTTSMRVLACGKNEIFFTWRVHTLQESEHLYLLVDRLTKNLLRRY